MVPRDHLFYVICPDHLLAALSRGEALASVGYRGRFAPTPSGPLHLGNLRTALLSWLQARWHQGQWLLRIDDLDTPRVQPGATESALNDLQWLGLHWDGPAILQSERRGLYGSFLSALRRQGLVYACRCSRRQLAGSPRYPGTCRGRGLSWGLEDGRLPAWRLIVPEPFASSCGDPVLRRADGFVAYHLATVVDELSLGITEVVRGKDLAPACLPQQALAVVLGQKAPAYRHVPLLLADDGLKLSKRERARGLDPLKQQGWGPDRVVGHLAASLDLVPAETALSALELLDHLRRKPGLWQNNSQLLHS